MQKHRGWMLQTCSGCSSSQHIDVQMGFQPQSLLTSRALLRLQACLSHPREIFVVKT